MIGFVSAHGDALELFELTEEILDEMTPFVHFGVDSEWLGATRMLRDDGFCASRVQVSDDAVGIICLVGDQGLELNAFDERRNANRIEALARQQHEADKVAERIGEREYLGGHAAFRPADGLILSPPFAPCP